ncbi:hypothetical protein [Propioniciclava sinopodophylli]|uniref:hypothetical protein n=1 Tax=Propioniciclava sinopodophylli TaxID=1837344 RepID=UPI00248FE87E|nr:hypothetical protein [Propioniciclava sinopodophylli]
MNIEDAPAPAPRQHSPTAWASTSFCTWIGRSGAHGNRARSPATTSVPPEFHTVSAQ